MFLVFFSIRNFSKCFAVGFLHFSPMHSPSRSSDGIRQVDRAPRHVSCGVAHGRGTWTCKGTTLVVDNYHLGPSCRKTI